MVGSGVVGSRSYPAKFARRARRPNPEVRDGERSPASEVYAFKGIAVDPREIESSYSTKPSPTTNWFWFALRSESSNFARSALVGSGTVPAIKLINARAARGAATLVPLMRTQPTPELAGTLSPLTMTLSSPGALASGLSRSRAGGGTKPPEL